MATHRVAPSATVPNVVGHELAQALAELKAAGFQARVDNASGAKVRQVVASTRPGAGQAFAATDKPIVMVYASVEQLMPDLQGLTCAAAVSRLRVMHFSLAGCGPDPANGPYGPGLIQRQQPAAGQALTTNTTLRAWTRPDGVVVPDVLNMQANQAAATLSRAGLRARFTTSPVTQWHWVQTQSPGPGRKVAAQTDIVIGLVARYTVPNLSGLTCDQAIGTLAQAGLPRPDCVVEPQATNGAPGRIDRQEPRAEQAIAAPTTVRAWFAPVLVQVPDLVGREEAQASALLVSAHLSAEPSGPAAASGRTVVSQHPAAGTRVAPQSVVRFSLALTVPSLGGLTCEQARARGHEFGFDAVQCTLEKVQAQALDRVFKQTPGEHTSLAAAQAIQVWIAQPVRVPSVVGQDPSAARAAIAQAGLQAQLDASDGDRQVATQEPAAGSEVSPNSVVRLTTHEMTHVPDVTTLGLAQAIHALETAGLGHSADSTQDETMRRVASQSPPPNAHVPVGTIVHLRTQLYVAVPDVRDRSLSIARDTLLKARLEPRPDRGDQPDQRLVRDQQPAAGQWVLPGAGITLAAVLRVQVPDLKGLSCEAAVRKLQEVPLRKDRCAPGHWMPAVLGAPTVSAQSPAPGTTVDEGTVVSLDAKAPLARLTVVVGALLGGGWIALAKLGAWPLLQRIVRATPPTVVGPTIASVALRIDPDVAPRVTIRQAAAGGAAGKDIPDSDFGWRVETDDAQVFVRGTGILPGDGHAGN